jgi:hypothetical protein
MKLKARVIRSWDVVVDAEYGDDQDTLLKKAVKEADGKPTDETAVLLPNTKKGDDREVDD